MGIALGIDLGAISLKGAVLGGPGDRDGLERLVVRGGFAWLPAPVPLAVSPVTRIRGDPGGAAELFLATVRRHLGDVPWDAIRVTGSGAPLLLARWPVGRVNEAVALANACGLLAPDVSTVFDLGGQSSRFLRLGGEGARRRICDFGSNGECAAGTGAFIDQQASRLRYAVEEVGPIACASPSAARIAGRCAVFAKSDMVHAQQKGAAPAQILRGLCQAVARNYKGSIAKGRTVEPPVALVGGVAENAGEVAALREAFELSGDALRVPAGGRWFGAVGAALAAAGGSPGRGATAPCAGGPGNGERARERPLSLEGVLLLRERVRPAPPPPPGARVEAFLGIDVGSVSTNLVVLDRDGGVLHEIYTRTEGRPIQVVAAGLAAIAAALGDRIRVAAVGTTGSGRELIGELVGADRITDEITAHSAGAQAVSARLAGEPVDTIFEIGGQDAKFIALRDGVVVDFAMNEACAAGTGSFLEEQAERLGIAIQEEFARLAFSSRAPIPLGERCTVFMEQDLTAWLQRGARREDLVAGLAYSVALNYLHRVVRGRPLGQRIYFQGGTAYNDAVAAAFAALTGRRIVVPPHNGVMGAIGMALLAREGLGGTGEATRFRGFDLSRVEYRLREFVCGGCSNACDMQEFSVQGSKSYWGDRCGERYRRRRAGGRGATLPDLMALHRERLIAGYRGPAGAGPRVGLPRAMFFHERFPFWRAFLEELGCAVELSQETDRAVAKEGIDLAVAEFCFPIRVAHGHIARLLAGGVDFVLAPNMVNAEATPDTPESQGCPWAQTLPFLVRSVPRLAEARERILAPTVHFRLGEAQVVRELLPLGRRLGADAGRTREAVRRGYLAQQAFRAELVAAGRHALAELDARGEAGVVLLGRPYNLHDRALNLDLPRKLREVYGVNVLPLDCLPLEEDIRMVHPHMYWYAGRRILAAAQLAARRPRLHLIYCTNFKCGPDSFIKLFAGEAAGKPFLTLTFDEHSNDAGILTRCEAYLESQGLLRWRNRAATA